MGLCRSETSLVYNRFPGQSGLHRAIRVFKQNKTKQLKGFLPVRHLPFKLLQSLLVQTPLVKPAGTVTGAHGAAGGGTRAPQAPRSRTADGRPSRGTPSATPSPTLATSGSRVQGRQPGSGAEFRAPPRSRSPGRAGSQQRPLSLPAAPRPRRGLSAPTGRESGRPRLPSAGRPGSPERTRPTPSPFPGDPHPPPASAESTSSSAAIAFITAAAQAQERTSKPADRPTGRPRAAAALKTAPPAHASSSRWDDPRARSRHHRLGVPRSPASRRRMRRSPVARRRGHWLGRSARRRGSLGSHPSE